ncbi:MAG: DNA polymerase III subunit beta [Patescibacteria group bacterium]|nr:DNA polymerase III subunit beta [Patescibacteria group bacterium]MCL5224119.1 DNA polymerase III subunit beta [Patescibacteria group bacterium]
MKLIILKNNLKNGLDVVGRSVGNNINLPILGNVLIKAENNQIKFSTTNLELAITKTIYGKIVEDGTITIPHNIISNIVSNLSSERVNIDTKQQTLQIKTDSYEASLQSMPVNEFPIIPKVKETKEHLKLNAGVFKDGLSKVVVAAGISDLRPEISGVLLIIEPSILKLVATDSFRLAEASINKNQFDNTFAEQGLKVIIPLKTTQELLRVVGDDEDLSIRIEGGQILFQTNDTEIVSRLIDGKFPDYEPIIPKGVDTEVLISREELTNAVKLTGSFTSRVSDVRLKTKDKKALEIYSNDSALGENNYLIPAKISGEGAELAFNWRYLLDGIKILSGKQVNLGLNAGNKASLLKSPDDASCFYILMPIRQ